MGGGGEGEPAGGWGSCCIVSSSVTRNPKMGGPAACTLQSSTPDHGTQKPQNLPGPVSQGTQSSWEALPAGPELQALPPAQRFRHFPGPGPGQRCPHPRENKTTCPLEEEVPVHSEPEGNVVCSSSMEPGPPRGDFPALDTSQTPMPRKTFWISCSVTWSWPHSQMGALEPGCGS